MIESKDGAMPPDHSRNSLAFLTGPLLAAALAILLEILRYTPLRISNPPALFIIAIVYAGFRGGLGPALASAGISWLYTAYFFAVPGHLDFTEENLRRIAVWGVTMPLIAYMVGVLNRRAVEAVTRARLAMLEREKAEERTRTEEDLRRSEAYLAEAQRLAHAGSWAWNVHTRDYVHWSREHYRLHGLDSGQGLPTWEAVQRQVHPDDRHRYLEKIERAVAERADWSFEYRCVLPDGTTRMIHSIAHPVFGAGGELIEFVGTEIDVTERQEAEKALSDSHDLLRAVIEGTQDAIFAQDLQGRYRMINSAGARFLGKSVEEVIGRANSELLPKETAQALRARDLRLLVTGETETFEETITSDSGTRTYHSTKGPYRDRQGNVIGLVGIARDVSEMKRLENQFRQAQKMEALGRLAGGVAHDFNNLLTVITGYSEMVFNALGPDDRGRELLAQVQKAAERAVGLTRQLLAFSRKQVLLPQVLRLNPLLADLSKMLQRLIGEDVELIRRLDAEPGRVKVDSGQFEQAIVNMAVNSRDAINGTGRLTIETGNFRMDESGVERHPDLRPGDYVVVTVSDTGHGMDDATKARIFEPFFTTKEEGKGTGLGLAMVYGFVRQSGGYIEVDSEPGRGTTFRLYLPRTEESGSSTRSDQEDIHIPKGDESILLVEDEEAVRALVRLVLQSYGYTVLEARDGQDALLISQQYPGTIHAVVTDLVMPRMGGRQLVENLVRMRPSVQVLYMSGHTDDAVLQREAEAGAAFVHKPFTPLTLARKVRQLLDAGTRPSEVARNAPE